MSKTVTCDRCGAEKHAAATEVICRPGDTTWTEVFDLCGKCYSKLRHGFLAGKPDNVVTNNVTITNNRAAEDRVGESCAKLAAAEERLAHERRKATEGLAGLPKISPDTIKFTGQIAGIGAQGLLETLSVKRPWWKFWA